MAAQINLALDNLEAVLAQAGKTLANLVRLNAYTTDVDAFLDHFSIAGPDQLIELEATAVD
jgi:enamine deaminase RidA (YjgF/YER057c/UK114 family)